MVANGTLLVSPVCTSNAKFVLYKRTMTYKGPGRPGRHGTPAVFYLSWDVKCLGSTEGKVTAQSRLCSRNNGKEEKNMRTSYSKSELDLFTWDQINFRQLGVRNNLYYPKALVSLLKHGQGKWSEEAESVCFSFQNASRVKVWKSKCLMERLVLFNWRKCTQLEVAEKRWAVHVMNNVNKSTLQSVKQGW